jgi:hypothetical protein
MSASNDPRPSSAKSREQSTQILRVTGIQDVTVLRCDDGDVGVANIRSVRLTAQLANLTRKRVKRGYLAEIQSSR